MSSAAIDALVAEGVIERVSEDVQTGLADLDAARTHLESAAAIAENDPAGAFSLAYDAMRKSIVAHMRANGLRVRSQTGAHYHTGRYGIAALAGLGVDTQLGTFDTLRRTRNQSEYRGALVNAADVSEAIEHARAVLIVVAGELV